MVKKALSSTPQRMVAIEKFVKATGTGRHGPHPRYTQQIRQALQNFQDISGDVSPADAKKFLEDLIDGTDDYAGIRNIINNSTGKNNDLDLQFP